MDKITVEMLAKTIDHSLLNPIMTDKVLEEGMDIALRYDVASVCIKPYYVPRAAEKLKGSKVAVGTVIGFPQGGNTTEIKVKEAEQAMAQGAIEIDLVANIGKVLSEDWAYVEKDLAAVISAVKKGGARSKVIFENCFLQDPHKIRLCQICEKAGADWVKTSTGYGSGGATDADLKLMRANVSAKVQVKAAGGVRTLQRLLEVVRIGCSRVGATATIAMLDEAKQKIGSGKTWEEIDKIFPSAGGEGKGY